MKRVGTQRTASVLCCVLAASAFARSATPKRSVVMEIILPNSAIARVMVRENEGVVIRLPDTTRYGFVPTVRDPEDASVVLITIWDVNKAESRQLGRVEVTVAGTVVQSDTVPSFGVRVPRLVTSK